MATGYDSALHEIAVTGFSVFDISEEVLGPLGKLQRNEELGVRDIKALDYALSIFTRARSHAEWLKRRDMDGYYLGESVCYKILAKVLGGDKEWIREEIGALRDDLKNRRYLERLIHVFEDVVHFGDP